jgi:hypothetical protein
VIEITRFSKIGGPLTKRISLSSAGTLHSDGSAGALVYVRGRDDADVQRFLRTLHDRCWLAG